MERLGVLPVDEAPSAAAELAAGVSDGGMGSGSRSRNRRGWGWDGLGGCGHVTIIPRKRHDARSFDRLRNGHP
jgi:hypothetical protein